MNDSLDQQCAQNRRYRVCTDDSNVGYYGFEDGTDLYGVSAAVGFCLGETDGSEDGNCAGGLSSCQISFEPVSCEAAPECNWTPSP